MNLKRLARTVFLIGLICILLAACNLSVPASTPVPAQSHTLTPVPTPDGELVTQADKIVGVWQVANPHCDKGFMIIRPDGMYTWSCNRDGSSGVSGTYRLGNNQFVIKNDFCGAEGQYEARLIQDNGQPKSLIFTLIKDDCSTDVDALTKQRPVWLSPLP